MLVVVVEAPLHIAQSYAVVAQYLLLALLAMPDVQLHVAELPLFSAAWERQWDLFSDEEYAQLAAIPGTDGLAEADLTVRVTMAYTRPVVPSRALLVLSTCEQGRVSPAVVSGPVGLAQTNDTLVTPSAWSERGLRASGARRVHVVPHGVDVETFRPLPKARRARLRSALGWTGRRVFLSVGAMTPNKGIEGLLAAFEGVAAAHPDALLVLKAPVGIYRSRREALRAAAPALFLSGAVQLLESSVSFADMALLYASADVYVAPYRAEAFALPVLEAVACGLPVIVTAGGPTDDWVRPEFAATVDAAAVALGSGFSELAPDLGHLRRLLFRFARGEHPAQATAREAGPRFAASSMTWAHAARELVRLAPMASHHPPPGGAVLLAPPRRLWVGAGPPSGGGWDGMAGPDFLRQARAQRPRSVAELVVSGALEKQPGLLEALAPALLPGARVVVVVADLRAMASPQSSGQSWQQAALRIASDRQGFDAEMLAIEMERWVCSPSLSPSPPPSPSPSPSPPGSPPEPVPLLRGECTFNVHL